MLEYLVIDISGLIRGNLDCNRGLWGTRLGGCESQREVTRVLLVEDNPDDAVLVREMLDDPREDRVVTWVENLVQAAGVLNSEPIDVVILDLRLPDASGMETVLKIRALAPWVPVVVLSGSTEDSLQEASRAAGVRAHLQKWRLGDRDHLAQALRFAISRRQADRELREAEAVLRMSLEASSSGTWRYVPETSEMSFAGSLRHTGELGSSVITPRRVSLIDLRT